MHINSAEAYEDEKRRLSHRAKIILAYLNMQPATDRDVMHLMGYTDPNAVRPRVTELIQQGFAEEVGTTKCRITGKTVRLVRGIPSWQKARQTEFAI